jgi:hypothetical protein
VQGITMWCLDRTGNQGSLDVSFEYDPTDPFAVWLRFGREEHTVRWVICRELLSRGLTDPVGKGDVRLRPATDPTGRSVVVFEFDSPDGRMVARAATGDVFRFVTRTLASVPAGTESTHLDLDRVVADLLDRSQAE